MGVAGCAVGPAGSVRRRVAAVRKALGPRHTQGGFLGRVDHLLGLVVEACSAMADVPLAVPAVPTVLGEYKGAARSGARAVAAGSGALLLPAAGGAVGVASFFLLVISSPAVAHASHADSL